MKDIKRFVPGRQHCKGCGPCQMQVSCMRQMSGINMLPQYKKLNVFQFQDYWYIGVALVEPNSTGKT